MPGPEATVGAGAVAWKTCRPELGLFAGDVDHLGLAGPHYATNCRIWGRSHLLLGATSNILNSISAWTSQWRVTPRADPGPWGVYI